jgi:hypothetical protein
VELYDSIAPASKFRWLIVRRSLAGLRAKALDLEVPDKLIALADEVIA